MNGAATVDNHSGAATPARMRIFFDNISHDGITEEKRCDKCGSIKQLYIQPAGYKVFTCRKCKSLYNKERSHRLGIYKPFEESKDCAFFLGIHVAERVLSRYFDGIERMPINNPGYDFVCKRGYKIDVKSSCLNKGKLGKLPGWTFKFNQNVIADYFLCLAFDDREHLQPQHIWLIPGDATNRLGRSINSISGVLISNTSKSLRLWAKFEKPLDKVLSACETLRGGDAFGSVTD